MVKKSFQLTSEQRDLAIQLSNYSKTIQQAYEGAIFSLYQTDDPDRFAHFAHSLREVIDLLAKLHLPRENWRENREFNRKSLLQSVIDPLGKQAYAYDTEYQTLNDEYGTLSAIAHHSEAIAEEEAIQKLTQTESILKILTIPQTKIYDEIDKIISNSPNDTNAEKLKSFQIRWATNSYLIENLPAKWLPNMINVGFFDNPQPAIIKENNLPIYQIWAPSRYLIRCAEKFPDETYELISNFQFKKERERNPSIYVDFLECSFYLQPSKIEKIAQKSLIEKWHDFTGNYFFTEKYVQLTERLFLENKSNTAIQLFEHIFYPKLSGNQITTNVLMEDIVYRKVEYPFEKFWFEKHFKELMTKFASKEPTLIIKSLTKLLTASIKLDIEGKKTEKGRECSSDWRPAIEGHEQNYSFDIRSIFVSHLVNSLTDLGRTNLDILKENMNILQEQDFSIFRRLELYLFTLFPNEFKNEIEKYLIRYFDNTDFHHEYYNLIKKTFNQIPRGIQEEIYKLIDNGFTSEKFDKRKAEYGEELAETQERHWKFTKLESISEHLDDEHKEVYSKLNKEFQPSEHPGFLSYHTTQIGAPTTDATIFQDKSIDEVFDQVNNHKIVEDLSHYEDKVVRTFGEYVAENPLECSKKAFELKDAEPIFHYELFYGLKQALEKNSKLDWNGVLQLIEYDVKLCHQDEEYSPKWSDRITESYSLLENGFKKLSFDFTYKEKLWDVLKVMVEIGTRHHESEDYPKKDTHSLDISMNNLNGKSFHVLYQYAVWCESKSDSKRFLVPDVKKIFEDYLDKKLGGHTISRHAVLGVFFPNFYYLDPTFVKEILQKIVSDKNMKIAFWDAYVSWNDLRRYVFADLYGWYREFLKGNLITDVNTNRAYQATIDHAILAYLYDLNYVDESFEQFLDSGNYSEVEHCVSQLAYVMKDKEDDEKFNKEKLIKLWKHSSILKHDLHMWFLNSPLDSQITIELYLNHLKQYSGKINLLYAPILEFQKNVKDSPQTVADCIEVLVEKQDNNYIPNEIEDILKSLLEIDDKDVKLKCETIIEKLATLGKDLRNLINK